MIPARTRSLLLHAPLCQMGLLVEIDAFMAKYPDTEFVVIDTFQLVRDNTQKQNYAGDYLKLHQFVEYAQKKDIAIILIHRLRKMPNNDPTNMVSGLLDYLVLLILFLYSRRSIEPKTKQDCIL